MSLARGRTYVKSEDDRIYVRGSAFANWSVNSFSASDAREIAKMLTDAADRIDRPIPSRTAVPLTLTRSQAEALAAVLNRVGGNPTKSPRGKTQAVYQKLLDGGVKVPDFKFETVAGGLWFKDYDGSGVDELTRSYAELFYAFAGAD